MIQPFIGPFSRQNPKYIASTLFHSPPPSMEDRNNNFSLPLLQPTATLDDKEEAPTGFTTEPFLSNSCIFLRLFLVLSIGIISIWANVEASKGFDITIVNDAKDSPASKLFTLLYISNAKATRIVLNTSSFVENVLYGSSTDNYQHEKKVVSHVVLRLSGKNMTKNTVTVSPTTKKDEFVIALSPSVLTGDLRNLDHAMTSEVLRGMARIWLWNGESNAPSWLLDGMVEYIAEMAGLGGRRHHDHELPEFEHYCVGHYNKKEEDPNVAARLLGYFEGQEKGFIRRLNQALRTRWDDRKVEIELGMSLHNLCGSYRNSSSSNGIARW